jgi:hypothetical protein
MQALTPSELLVLWDAGSPLGPLDRGVLVAHATSSRSENPADWPLGRRNRALAQLHCATFGSVLRGWTRCRGCGEQLEFSFDGHGVANATPESAEHDLVKLGVWSFRLPTSRDLAAVVQEQSEQTAARRLMSACLVGSERGSEDWSDDDVRAIEEGFAEADPLAEIRLHFECPACSASFDENMDLGRFVWATIDSQAKRLLRDVHILASTYGWSEGQILALSPSRRSTYLQLVLG